MSEKTETLRLADHLESRGLLEEADELRRLHAENEALRRERAANLDTINVDNGIITRLSSQRDALLEEISALREVLLYSLDNQGRYRKKHRKIVDAAIKAVEGE